MLKVRKSQLHKPVALPKAPASDLPSVYSRTNEPKVSQLKVGQLKTVRTAPGRSYDCMDELSQDRSHSFAFRLDQTRRVAIDLANERDPGLFGGLLRSRHIEVTLWNESGQKQALFSVAPGDRDRETVTLRSGRYLLELKTHTHQKIDYALKLMPMKWLMLGCFAT